jgi:hypothetical protein
MMYNEPLQVHLYESGEVVLMGECGNVIRLTTRGAASLVKNLLEFYLPQEVLEDLAEAFEVTDVK